MSWVDIVIIAFVVLLAGLGVLKGVKKSSVALVAFAVAFVIAFFLSNVVAEAMLNIEGVKRFVLGGEGFSLYTWLYKSIGSSEPSEFLVENFYRPVLDVIGGYAGYTPEFTIAQGQALYLAFTVFSAIVGVGLFLVARLLLTIVTVIIKSYIGRKKSGLSRLFGFFVGAIRGAAWAMAITIVFSAVGGFSFVGAFDKVESEYEKSVIGKYVNQYSYAVKNKLFLPDADMYARIVDKSGFAVKGGDETPPADVTGTRLDIYISLMNFNCTGDKYSKDAQDKLTVNEEVAELNPAVDFGDSGYAELITSIMNYNTNAATGIWNRTLLADDISAAELGNYMNIIQSGNDSIYNAWNDIITDLRNYEFKIDDSRGITNEDVIRSVNADLKTLYDSINGKLDSLSAKYASLSALGAFPELTKPDVVVLTAAAA